MATVTNATVIAPDVLVKLGQNFTSFIIKDLQSMVDAGRVENDYDSLYELANDIEYELQVESQGWGNAER